MIRVVVAAVALGAAVAVVLLARPQERGEVGETQREAATVGPPALATVARPVEDAVPPEPAHPDAAEVPIRSRRRSNVFEVDTQVYQLPGRSVHVEGVVVDAVSGLPVVGASVNAGDLDHMLGRMTVLTTGRDGEFRGVLSLLPDGPDDAPVSLVVKHPDFVPEDVAVPGKGSSLPVRVALRRGIRIRGSVLDEHGEGAYGADVYLLGLPSAASGAEVGIARTTTENGRFEFGPVEPGVATAIAVPAQDFAQANAWSGGARVEISAERDVEGVVVRLGMPVTFDLDVRERDGSPNLGVDEILTRDERGMWVSRRSMTLHATAGVPLAVVVLARRNGPNGEEHLRGEGVACATEADVRDRGVVSCSVTVLPTASPRRPEQSADLLTVGGSGFLVRSELHRWTLRLVDASTGSEIDGRAVSLEHGGQGVRRSVSKVLTLDLPLGTQVVHVRCGGYAPRTIRLEATALGESTEIVRLDPLRGR